RKFAATVLSRVEIKPEINWRVRWLAKFVRKLDRSRGVLATLIASRRIRHIKIHAIRVAVLKYGDDRQPGVFDRLQLVFGQGLGRTVPTLLADTAAVLAVIIAGYGANAGGFDFFDVLGQSKIGVDQL